MTYRHLIAILICIGILALLSLILQLNPDTRVAPVTETQPYRLELQPNRLTSFDNSSRPTWWRGTQYLITDQSADVLELLTAIDINSQDITRLMNAESAEELRDLQTQDRVIIEADDGNLKSLRLIKGHFQALPFAEKLWVRHGDRYRLNLHYPQTEERRLTQILELQPGSNFKEDSKVARLPQIIADDAIDILASAINITELKSGDRIAVEYQALFLSDYPDIELSIGNVNYLRYDSDDTSVRIYRFSTNGDGHQYFYADGTNVRKALLRYPFAREMIVSSPYASERKHPVLNKILEHHGTDYAAPISTEILAAASGTVAFAGIASGYGNTVILQHDNNLRTLYAHLNAFGPGITAKAVVNQRQVIGYVGTTGLSTGPHLHYEVQLGRKPINPDADLIPSAQPVPDSSRPFFDTLVRQTELRFSLLAPTNEKRAN